jgi:enoyl-CoA hydratase
MTSAVRVERQGHLAEITLARPDSLNRFDGELIAAFDAALSGVRAAEDLRAVMLAAEGRCFSAGGDTRLMEQLHDDDNAGSPPSGRRARLIDSLLAVPVPIVCALAGPAYGLGATVALACDVLVSAPGVSLADPHVRFGLVAGDGGCLIWPHTAGFNTARRYLLTGDPLDAEAAHAAGLVTDLVASADEVLPEARRIAERIAALPPLGVRGTKRALMQLYQQRAAEVLELSAELERETLRSADMIEAVAAFKERRPGRYYGR